MSKIATAMKDKEPPCPECGGKMKYRHPDHRLGQNWIPYWYCVRFPDCNGMIKEEEVKANDN